MLYSISYIVPQHTIARAGRPGRGTRVGGPPVNLRGTNTIAIFVLIIVRGILITNIRGIITITNIRDYYY